MYATGPHFQREASRIICFFVCYKAPRVAGSFQNHRLLGVLQGPTSSGKTSLVAFLAAQTGHSLVRINNHEQTDLQEYLGSYISDETGRLVFREGALVQAVRQGHWLLLDELNLAPSQVLEALNRWALFAACNTLPTLCVCVYTTLGMVFETCAWRVSKHFCF